MSEVSPWKSIRIDRVFPLPPYLKAALQKLDEAGHVAYIVGGSVRDFLLSRETKDHDVATSATPDEICELFPNGITVGKAFGVIKVPTGTEPQLLEIATFRQDLDYKDHRHPKGIVISNPTQDAFRRDFTINALFFDPKTSRILDITGGLEDLKSGVIRAIGDPAERFKEDALRLLRAIRFKTRLGFQLEENTLEAIQDKARLISKISAERIRDELTLMWTGPHPEIALKLLGELGLLQYVLPEVDILRKSNETWSHLVKTLECLAKHDPVRSLTLAWMSVLHEVGRPLAAKSYEVEGAKLAREITNRLKMPKGDTEKISLMVGAHLRFREVFQMRESTLQRFLREDYFEELLSFHRADAICSDGNLAFYEFCATRLEAIRKSKFSEVLKLIDGKDLIQLGFSPGPEFSEILRAIEDLSLERKLTTKEEALEYVVKNFVR